jgi:hypothetical protein
VGRLRWRGSAVSLYLVFGVTSGLVLGVVIAAGVAIIIAVVIVVIIAVQFLEDSPD